MDSISEHDLYEFLLKDCTSLTQQIEELLKENVEPAKKSQKNQNNFMTEQNFEEKPENFEKNQNQNLQTDINEKIDLNDEAEEKKSDYTKKKEALLNQKKYIEDQFLDINIDIQKKAKQLSDFQETIKKTKLEISTCDKQIKEKSDFIQFLEQQIDSLACKTKKR